MYVQPAYVGVHLYLGIHHAELGSVDPCVATIIDSRGGEWLEGSAGLCKDEEYICNEWGDWLGDGWFSNDSDSGGEQATGSIDKLTT